MCRRTSRNVKIEFELDEAWAAGELEQVKGVGEVLSKRIWEVCNANW